MGTFRADTWGVLGPALGKLGGKLGGRFSGRETVSSLVTELAGIWLTLDADCSTDGG